MCIMSSAGKQIFESKTLCRKKIQIFKKALNFVKTRQKYLPATRIGDG